VGADGVQYRKGDLRGYIWWCCDDYCDCTQPVIERIRSNPRAPRGAVSIDRLWEGAFHSGADRDEARRQQEELSTAAIGFGLIDPPGPASPS